MELAYLVPVHVFGKLVVIFMVAYSLYVLIRLWVLLVSFAASSDGGTPNGSGRASSSQEQDTYIGRARRIMSAIGDVEQADWKAVLATLREPELAKLNFARSAPNTLLLLGLLGTVVGLGETVGSLVKPFSNATSNANPQDVLNLLSFTLQQMGTAFSCTIWGIVFALIMSGAVRSCTGKVLFMLSEWDTYILENAVPDILPKKQAAQIQSLQELVSRSQEIVAESRKFLAKIAPLMREAAEQFQSVLVTAGEAMRESVEKLTQTAQAMQERLQDVAQGVTQSASALENSSRELRDSTKQLAEYHTDLRNAHQELLTVFEQARSDLENQIRGQLEKIGALDENFRRNAQDIVSRINDAGRQFGEATEAFRQAGDDFRKEGTNIHSQIVTYHQQLTEYIENLLRDHRFAIDGVENSLDGINKSLHEIKNSPVWQSRNGGDNDRRQQHSQSEARTGPPVLTNGQGVRSLPGTVVGERPLPQPDPETTATTVVLDSTSVVETMKKLIRAVNELTDSIQRGERTELDSVNKDFNSRLGSLHETIESLRNAVTGDLNSRLASLHETIENLQNAVKELRGSLQALRPPPPKRRRWPPWLFFWKRGQQ